MKEQTIRCNDGSGEKVFTDATEAISVFMLERDFDWKMNILSKPVMSSMVDGVTSREREVGIQDISSFKAGRVQWRESRLWPTS